ncbi:MAG: SRPBCC family protein [Oscillospiraceae bacterium]|nr:SRPBCC family protein [Oscillospiraceae bacterium]
MAVSTVKATFQADVKKVWDIVTNLKNYAWRSDLSRIEVISENRFTEYTKDGFSTDFTITLTEQYRRWEFDLENANISGHWTGIFTSDGDQTTIDFTEDITAKKLFMKPLVKGFLKKQQAQYIEDLKRALEKNNED